MQRKMEEVKGGEGERAPRSAWAALKGSKKRVRGGNWVKFKACRIPEGIIQIRAKHKTPRARGIREHVKGKKVKKSKR